MSSQRARQANEKNENDDGVTTLKVIQSCSCGKAEFQIPLSTTSLKNFKKLLESNSSVGSIPVGNQRIFFMGRELKTSGRTLASLGVGNRGIRVLHVHSNLTAKHNGSTNDTSTTTANNNQEQQQQEIAIDDDSEDDDDFEDFDDDIDDVSDDDDDDDDDDDVVEVVQQTRKRGVVELLDDDGDDDAAADNVGGVGSVTTKNKRQA
eukprot:CAMPEP_0198154864 /NCGR_PEP_ID=MMETSP1443-20131203/68833_1 /TAXON_ID=186043 /ORGANISM="Entomoneis sp., Strain CCMP2396" /LENGTH=205 /DNA_ID=CAMNT_0043821581 /DNA_START=579 /DNA_END=1196 /DNA_ORIENTATION=-